MGWAPQSWKDVWPGQDWDLDGERVHVGAIFSDSYERTALCTVDDGSVLHLPATVLFDQGRYVGGRHQ